MSGIDLQSVLFGSQKSGMLGCGGGTKVIDLDAGHKQEDSAGEETAADHIPFLDSYPKLEIKIPDGGMGETDGPVPEVADVSKDTPAITCQDGDPAYSLQISWLKSQIGKTGLVDSYKDDGTDKAYLYDQAVAAMAFTQSGETCEARQIFKTIAMLQNPNGGWNTCYSAADNSPCEIYVHTGPIAWVVLAINFYEIKTGDMQFSPLADKGISWMDTMIVSSGEAQGALKYGEGYPQVSTEHNQDAYSAYFYRGKADKAGQIKNYLLSEMWATSPASNGPYHNVSVYWRGFNDFAWCTDPQSWGVLALGADYAKSLEWLDSDGYGWGSTKNTKQGIEGFSFCTEDQNSPNGMNPNFCGSLFVWLEGTEGVAAAYYSVGDIQKGDYYHGETAKKVSAGGGVPYSISEGDIKWPCNYPYESAAATSWYYFNAVKINPFNPQ